MRQLILDTETTGLEPANGHRIIEIGCIELVNRRFTGNNFHTYINPGREVDRGALKVHGISNTFLKNKPVFADIYPKLKEYITGSELIIHNAAFDLGFLDHEFLLLNRSFPRVETFCKVFDTLGFARKLHPGQRNSLDALCKRYQVDNSSRKLHGALLDAEILAKVYLAMTGGQKSLFDAAPENANGNEQSTPQEQSGHSDPVRIWDLAVIEPSSVELKNHHDYLEEIQKEKW